MVWRDILTVPHHTGPFNLIAPALKLNVCRTDSFTIFSDLKRLVVNLASNTIHNQLFSIVVSGYSLEPQTVLDHKWQSYLDKGGNLVPWTAQVYYITFLNTIRSFYDMEEYLINMAWVFMSHIDPQYAMGFKANYPNHGKTWPRLATNQRCILIDMLQALIKTEAAATNIPKVIH
jgi:hypothetical protein